MLCKNCNHNTNNNQNFYRKYQLPYANFVSYSYENLHEDVSKDVAGVIAFATETENLRDGRNKLRDMTQSVKFINLNAEHKQVLFSQLNEINDKIIQKQDEIYKQFEVEHLANYEIIKPKIDKLVELVSLTEEFKDTREQLITVKNEFNNLKLKKEHKEELITSINNSFEVLNTRQSEWRERYEMECTL